MAITSTSYSQYNQDLTVMRFYRNSPAGYFLDVGAFDGIALSNTYKLERELGWTGICIEPQADAYAKLEDSRSAICINQAVASEAGESVEFSKGRGGNSVLSGITRFLDGFGKKYATRGESLTLTTNTLSAILKQHGAPSLIHFMSLDTEGSELDILRGLDLDRYIIGFLCVEHNYSEPRRSQMRELLESKGYCFLAENECDDNYYHRSMVGGVYYFNNDLERPIDVTLNSDNTVVARSAYWPDAHGLFYPQSLEIRFESLGNCRVSGCSIERSAKNSWHKHPVELSAQS